MGRSTQLIYPESLTDLRGGLEKQQQDIITNAASISHLPVVLCGDVLSEDGKPTCIHLGSSYRLQSIAVAGSLVSHSGQGREGWARGEIRLTFVNTVVASIGMIRRMYDPCSGGVSYASSSGVTYRHTSLMLWWPPSTVHPDWC